MNPAGYDGRGLQFALEFAYFLQRQNDNTTARDVLLTALLLIDMDRNPNSISNGKPILDTEGLDLPERPVRHGEMTGRACRGSSSFGWRMVR